MDLNSVDKKIACLEQCTRQVGSVGPDEPLLVGVDLGTAYIVVVVLNAAFQPIACAMKFAQVLKDGLVVDYTGATRIVKALVRKLEKQLNRSLDHAAIAVPPGTGKRDAMTHSYVVEGAGLEVTSILDEPTAANSVLEIQNGVVVDIGGGTTGLSIFEDGKVVYTADEPTGGTHLTLVVAGNYKISFEEAETMKTSPKNSSEIFNVVYPVIQKMATIVKGHIIERDISEIFLVGGTCCLKHMEKVFESELGLPVYKPTNPFLVTPLGIAMNCGNREKSWN